jgi:hypothetical protein
VSVCVGVWVCTCVCVCEWVGVHVCVCVFEDVRVYVSEYGLWIKDGLYVNGCRDLKRTVIVFVSFCLRRGRDITL